MIFKESAIKNQQGFSFHLKEWLPGTSALGLVFLLHGLADHSGRFRHVGEALAREGLVFFAPDLRGNGRSEGKRGHFDSYNQVMDDIDFLLGRAIEENPGIPAFIYGQSMGGNLALNYCIRRKPAISGVIASSPWLRLAKEPTAINRIVGSALGYFMPSLSLPNRLNADDLTHDPEICNLYRNDPLVHGRISLNTFKIITASGEWALRNSGMLSLPVLLLHGTSDNITSYEASKQLALSGKANCTFISKRGLYHELHNEPGNQETITEMINWMKIRM